jgi:hypothetical protein
MIEDLTRSKNLDAFERLLSKLYAYLESEARKLNFEIYQFTGDGWILLFPANNVEGRRIITFLVSLSKHFRSLRKKFVENTLRLVPQSRGLTFGLALGRLRTLQIGNRQEFLGRSLILACRLQAGVGQKGRASYRVLVSRTAYNRYFTNVDGVKFFNVKRKIKNLRGGNRYKCKKLSLVPLMREA